MPPVTQYTIKQSLASKIATKLHAIWATAAGKILLIIVSGVIIASGGFATYLLSRPGGAKNGSNKKGPTTKNDSGAAQTNTTSDTATSSPKAEEKKEATKPTVQSPTSPTSGNSNTATTPTSSGSTNTGGTTPTTPGGGTSTPPSFQANCITTPSSCGYPDATNTGVPTGTTLTNSGSITVNVAGTVIDRMNVSGQIIVRANNVTIRNTRITSGDYYPIDYDGYTGLVVEDTEIIGTSTIVTAGISFRDYTARRVHVRGTLDGFKADANVLIEDSFVSNLYYDAINDSHNDGVQTTGGSNVTLRHNTFKLSTTPQTSAVIQIGTEWGGNTNWLVTNNLLDGGGWTINSGTSNASMVFTNNRFTRNSGYGVGHETGMTWSGNYYDNDGTTVP